MTDELARLLSWYAMTWMEEAEGIDRLHEPHPGPDDLTGAPEWSPKFKGYLFAKATDTDDDGYFRRPLRAALAAVATNDAEHYAILAKLRVTWDPETAAGYGPDAEERVTAALHNLRRLYMARAA